MMGKRNYSTAPVIYHFLILSIPFANLKYFGFFRSVLIGFMGVYIMMKPELKDGLSWNGLGQVAVIGAAVCYGLV
jgi:hypothetical protein